MKAYFPKIAALAALDLAAGCVSAWNKDPVFGVIGIQSGPRRRMGSHLAFDVIGGHVGMLVVETIAKIRRAFFHQKKAIKTISRELKVSRKVIRKVIRSGATESPFCTPIGGANCVPVDSFGASVLSSDWSTVRCI